MHSNKNQIQSSVNTAVNQAFCLISIWAAAFTTKLLRIIRFFFKKKKNPKKEIKNKRSASETTL